MKILVIRRDNIGDLVCTTPALAALRRSFQNAEIRALVNSYNADVLRHNPDIDLLYVYQKIKHVDGFVNRVRALFERCKLILRIRNWDPDVVILAKSGYDKNGLNFARKFGARNIIGFIPADLSNIGALPDIRIATPIFTSLHEVEAINQLLSPLGVKDALGPLRLFPDLEYISAFHARLPPAAERIAVHISARESERRWGIDNFISFIGEIIEDRPDAQVLLLWSPGKVEDPHHPGDDENAILLMQAVKSDQVIPVASKTVSELIAILSLCQVFIGADGGAMHLAAALNIKVVALFENSADKLVHWRPWMQGAHQVLHSLDPGRPEVSQISVPRVVAALDMITRYS